jgi:hypothetical protein
MKQLAGRDFEDLLQVCNMNVTTSHPLTQMISAQSPSLTDSFQRRTTKSYWIYCLNLQHGKCWQVYVYIQNLQSVPSRTPRPAWARFFANFNPPPVTRTTPMSYRQRRQLEDVEQQPHKQKRTTMIPPKLLKIQQRQRRGGPKRYSICRHTRYTLSVTTLEQFGCLAPQTGSLRGW